MTIRRLLLAGAVLALAGCASGDKHGPVSSWNEAPPQVVEQDGATGSIYKGSLDKTDYQIVLTTRTYDSGGKLGVCAIARLLSEVDISERIREGLGFPDSALLLRAKNGGRTLSISPRFATLLYANAAPGKESTALVAAAAEDKPEGACVVTDYAWDERWSAGNYAPKLWLYTRDMRKRSLSVVGQ
jgi:hypothetical protein